MNFVLYRGDRSPEIVIVRTRVLLLAALLLSSCRSPEGPVPEGETWRTGMKDGARKVASATAHGAEAVRGSVDTAYRGVKTGYAEPDQDAYGPYPRDYAGVISKHMRRYEGVDETASFEFGRPVRAYLNEGLLRGGEVEWQGWIVDLEIEARTLFGQPRALAYVVRMKDGEVIEVIDRAHAGALTRVPGAETPAPAAPRR